jgi:hypothetical protein
MPAKQKVANIVSIPAPIGGWNIRDPLPNMEPIFAPILDNCFCLPSEIQIRKGYTKWAEFDGVCKTIVKYSAATGDEMLIACVDTGSGAELLDVSDEGEEPVQLVTGLTSANFKFSAFSTTGGFFSYYVNNTDPAIMYDGTTWHEVTTTSTPYAITGVTDTVFLDVISHKRRLWFVPDDSLEAYYLPTDSIAGEAKAFDFAPIFKFGGKIVKIDTWSLDAGTGLDDHFLVFTSKGEVAVYTGTDPASASTWSLNGVFYIGAPTQPVGQTCKYGGDLLIINKDGIAQMSKSLMSSRVNTWLQMSDKIQPQLAQDNQFYGQNEGWDILLYPPANMLLVNIPVNSTTYYQYVMNTISGAWSRWTGLPARCWLLNNDNLYFGADGFVAKAWNTQSDNGADITADILPAYQNFGATSQLKRWTMGRIILGSTADLTYGGRMEIDFNLNPNPVGLPYVGETSVAIYGTATYGSDTYGGNVTIRREWKNLTGMGYWGAFHVQFRTKQSDIRLYAMDVMGEAGGNI